MDKTIHIISFDIPYPADYGGVIDVFYKIVSLHKLGIKIILHCFEYGDRKAQIELKKYCEKIFYYKRKNGILGIHYSLPYIVSSRINNKLLINLSQDNYPILFEGIHTCFYINHPSLKERIKMVRSHNIESEYYLQLAKNEKSFLKKIYYYVESARLARYENILYSADALLCISVNDTNYFSKKYEKLKTVYIPAFHTNEEVNCKVGKGEYCLYHGNLSVAENIESVKYLCNNIFNKIDFSLVISGKNPTKEVMEFASNKIKIIPNPSFEKMKDLIANAHINVLPSFQNTGMKLKIIESLFVGRFCILNDETIDNHLKQIATIAPNTNEFIHEINNKITLSFTKEDIEKRKDILQNYLNKNSAKKIIDLIG